MKTLIMDRVVALLAEQPGLRIRDVVAAMPDVDRSTISSTLHRLSMRGVIVRRTGTNGRFRYSVATGQIIPLIPASTTVHPDDVEPPLPLPAMPMISQSEWERLYAAAVELEKKGLYRRCERSLLELLDVTAEVKQREQIIRHKMRTYLREGQ